MRRTYFPIVIALALICIGLTGKGYAKPGWGDCALCHNPPTVTDFSLPSSHDALRVPILTFTGTDTDSNKSSMAGVTGYLLTTSSSMPDSNASGWNASPPDEFVFPVSGLNTLYAWVKDTVGNISTSATAVVNIAMNSAPIANAGPDQTVDENIVVTLDGSNSIDEDDGIKTILWEQLDGIPVSIMDADMEIATFVTPNVGATGESLTFQLTVTDYSGVTVTDTCVVNVSWTNEPPVAIAGDDQTHAAGLLITLDGSMSSDADDGIDSYLWVQTKGTPVQLSDATSDQPTFTMDSVDQNGESLTFQLTVTDRGQLQATDTCIVNITWVNTAPIANAGANQEVVTGDLVTLDGTGSDDPDGGTIQYVWTQTTGTPVTLSHPSAAQPTFTAPELTGSSDTLTFLLTVIDDGQLQATATCEVRVTDETDPSPQNQAPTANAGPDRTVGQGVQVSLNGSGSGDPDRDTITFRWTQTQGTQVRLSDPTTANPTFISPTTGTQGDTITFSLVVTDPSGLSATDRCTVTILAADPPPKDDDGDDGDDDDGDDDGDDDDGDDEKRKNRDKKQFKHKWKKWGQRIVDTIRDIGSDSEISDNDKVQEAIDEKFKRTLHRWRHWLNSWAR